MDPYLQLYYLIHTENDLWKRWEIAVWKQALYVKNSEASGFTNHASRLSHAQAILADIEAGAKELREYAAENGDLQTAGSATPNSLLDWLIGHWFDTLGA